MEPVDVVTLAVPFFLGSIALEAAYSAWRGKGFYRLNDAVSDLSCGIVQQVSGVFLKLVGLLAFAWVAQNLSIQLLFGAPAWPDGNPFPAAETALGFGISWANLLGWVAAFVFIDHQYYWAHRKCHEVNAMWATHVVHHSSEEYNLAVALRQSAFQGLATFPFYLPVAFLGVSWVQFAVCMGLNLIYQFWIHTRAIDRMGWFMETFWNTPSHHRVHHGRNPKYIDRNHGGVFIIFDRMYGTFQVEEEEPIYGITTPINSWNPVWANLHHWRDMWADMRRTPHLADKLRILLGPPGWRPSHLGGPQMPQEVPSTYRPFDDRPVRPVQVYAMVQFGLLLAATLPMLQWVNAPSTSVAMQAAGVGFWILSLGVVGGIWERARWAWPMEVARQALTAGVAGALALQATQASQATQPAEALAWLVPLLAAVAGLSLAALVWLRPRFTQAADHATGPSEIGVAG
jgi:sterol desaturase/sphingolipid hydroxylase (fatty acid hydroxylase superfamily)